MSMDSCELHGWWEVDGLDECPSCQLIRLRGELREAEQEIAVLGPSGKCLLCSERERERDEALARLPVPLPCGHPSNCRDLRFKDFRCIWCALLDRLQRAEAVVEALDCEKVFSGKPGSPKVDWYEDGIFNEKRLYAALGKEDARTVLGIWRRFRNAALAAWKEEEYPQDPGGIPGTGTP